MCTSKLALAAVLLLGSATLADDKAMTLTFSKNDTGKLPKGWTAAKTGEGEGSVWKVVAGKRVQLATKEELTVKAGEWHTLSIKHAGEAIECSLDGKKLLEAKDGAITKAGKVGLWTKADAQTYFDKLTVGGK